MVEIGYKLGREKYPPLKLVRNAKRAEDAGLQNQQKSMIFVR